jgi:hypothetical protein
VSHLFRRFNAHTPSSPHDVGLISSEEESDPSVGSLHKSTGILSILRQILRRFRKKNSFFRGRWSRRKTCVNSEGGHDPDGRGPASRRIGSRWKVLVLSQGLATVPPGRDDRRRSKRGADPSPVSLGDGVGVFSSSETAQARERNLACLAIVGPDRPDFRTLSLFRRLPRSPH